MASVYVKRCERKTEAKAGRNCECYKPDVRRQTSVTCRNQFVPITFNNMISAFKTIRQCSERFPLIFNSSLRTPYSNKPPSQVPATPVFPTHLELVVQHVAQSGA